MLGGSPELHGGLIFMHDGKVTPQNLHEYIPELPGGEVVEERVEDRAEVEEGVGHGVEDDVAPEVFNGPVGLGHSGHHKTANLVGKPAYHQGSNNEN